MTQAISQNTAFNHNHQGSGQSFDNRLAFISKFVQDQTLKYLLQNQKVNSPYSVIHYQDGGYIEANIKTIDKEKEFSFLVTETCMQGPGKEIYFQEKEFIFILMMTYIWGCFKKDIKKAMETINRHQEVNIKGNGIMIEKTDKERFFKPIKIAIPENDQMEKSMVKVLTNIVTGICIMANGPKTKKMGREFLFIIQEQVSTVNGLMIKHVIRVLLLMPMETSTKGTFFNGKKYGRREYIYRTGGKYIGSWFNDRKHGDGIMSYHNRDKCEGNWKTGQRSGKGIYEYENGDKYQGQWKNDSKNGRGILRIQTGDEYDGYQIDGKKNGEGKYCFTNGDVYLGSFKNGNRQGHGKYTWTDDSYYQGELLNDKMNGYGEYRNANGDVINGYFQNDNLIKVGQGQQK